MDSYIFVIILQFFLLSVYVLLNLLMWFAQDSKKEETYEEFCERIDNEVESRIKASL